MRRHASCPDQTLLFANAPAPRFVQALVNTFRAGWIFNGTPEAGVAAAACVEVGVQTVALCKNAAHSETIVRLVLAQVERCLVDGSNELCNRGFAARHADFSDFDSSSESSGESGTGPEEEEEKTNNRKQHLAKKEKKDAPAKNETNGE